MLKELLNFFEKPNVKFGRNLILILFLVAVNSYSQIMCIPTFWALIVLLVCFAATVVFPIIKTERQRLINLVSAINGVSFMLFIYCIIFMGELNVFGVVLVIVAVGLLILVPHYFVFQLLFNYVIRPRKNVSRKYFLIGVLFSFIMPILAGILYSKSVNVIKQAEINNYENIQPSFMTEKIVGMHFIYHTRFCIYDGWRPPKHEPLLVLGMWFNDVKDPLKMSLEDRINLYKATFPENRIKFDCSCAYLYNEDYHGDRLWNK